MMHCLRLHYDLNIRMNIKFMKQSAIFLTRGFFGCGVQVIFTVVWEKKFIMTIHVLTFCLFNIDVLLLGNHRFTNLGMRK